MSTTWIDRSENLSLDELLQRPADATSRASRTASFLGGGDHGSSVAYAGLTLGDLVYDALRVDPSVVQAADMVRTADIGDVAAFAGHAEDLLSLAPAAFEGSIHQLKGYVAERFVAQQLQAAGMEVELPATASNPGFDLLVNGEPFQVKCVASSAAIQEHLERYPEIPVLVNQEGASGLEEHPLVYPIEGFTLDGIEDVTRSSVDAGADLLDLQTPTIATAVALGRNALAVVQGRTGMRHGLGNVGSEVVGAMAGAKAGSWALGGALLVLGPYGAVVGGLLGGAAGSLGGRRFMRFARSIVGSREELAAADLAMKRLVRAASKASDVGAGAFERKSRQLRDLVAGTALAQFVEARLAREERDLERSRESLYQLQDSTAEPSRSPEMLLRLLRRLTQAKVHPHSVRAELKDALEACDALRRTWAGLTA